jgi:hypothetical protein
VAKSPVRGDPVQLPVQVKERGANVRRTTISLLQGVFLVMIPAITAGAAPAAPEVADTLLGAAHVEWVPNQEFAGLKLTISGPDGVEERVFAPGESPRFELAADTVDGLYTWELVAAPVIGADVRSAIAEARTGPGDGKRTRPSSLPPLEGLIQSGTFRVVHGAVFQPADETEAVDARRVVSAATANRALAETVISGDLTVYNSLCVGFDCLAAESYGSDTIRIKENNVRFHADDTSTTAGFASTDWRLEFNAQASGGGGYFRVIDASANRNVMTIEANAPSNSLFVDDGGRVGLGTATPVLQLHIASGNTPALRLDQNTSSGFAAQVWDIAGNETNFFVRDVTGGSTLPFRIFPGAASSQLIIDDTNRIGMGTTSPSSALHLRRTDGSAQALVEEASGSVATRTLLRLSNNGGAGFSLLNSNSAQEWRFDTGGADFNITLVGTGELAQLDTSGNLTIEGDLTANGTNYPSSRGLKTNVLTVDPEDVLHRLASVPVSTWAYKSDPARRHIGPMTEDFSAAFDFLSAEGKLNTIDLHGVALAAIQGLGELVAEKEARIQALERRLDLLEQTPEAVASNE